MIEIVPLIAFLVVLGYMAVHDLKYRSIPYVTIPVLFILTPIYIYLAELDFTIAGLSFFILAGCFAVIYVIGRGGFGVGDVIVMGVIGWLIADTNTIYVYMLYILSPTMFLWFCINMVYHVKKHGYHGWRSFFQFRKRISTKDLEPGMVLSWDNFMTGIREEDIPKLQEKYEFLEVKQPIAFIPVPFISLIVYYVGLYSGVM